MNAQPAPPKSPAAILSTSKPIDILPGQSSFSYAHLHPVVLLSLLAVSFNRLVADPTTTLLRLAPALVVLQALYCVLCLPSSGKAVPEGPNRPGMKKGKGKSGPDWLSRVVPAFLSMLLTFTLSTPTLFLILLLFGAPLTTHQTPTLLLALHLALLTTPPLFYVHGLDPARWLHLVSLQLPVDEVYGMALGACLGAWTGAIPIPLDWDREWQTWPVTVVVGVYVGSVVGKVGGGYVCKGMRMVLS